MTPPTTSLLALAALSVAGMGVQGGTQSIMTGSEHVNIRASSDFDQMHAGDRGLLAIDIIVDEGWHTYWPGVSDTGYGVSFAIDAPDAVELKDPIWPSPHRHLQKGGILDHTYEGTATVLVPFIVKGDTEPTALIFNIDASFLVCKEVCLPGEGSATVSVQVVDDASPVTRSSEHGRISELYDKRPEPFNPSDLAVRLQWIPSAAAVMHRDATRIEFYPDDDCSELLDLIKDGAADGNRLEIRFAEPAEAGERRVLSGRLRVKTPRGDLHFDIHETGP